MFFNIGGAEILVIAMVALIAVGPEQLPSVLRKVGRFVGQARSMTSGIRDEFMSGLDEVKDLADPDEWLGTGSNDDPVVPRGYANRKRAEEARLSAESADPFAKALDEAPSDGVEGTESDDVDADAAGEEALDPGMIDGGVDDANADAPDPDTNGGGASGEDPDTLDGPAGESTAADPVAAENANGEGES